MSTVASRRPPFVANRYAQELAKDGLHASLGGQVLKWSGTHWEHLEDNVLEREVYSFLLKSEEDDRATKNNVVNAVKATLLHLPPLAAPPLETVVLPARNGYIWIDAGAVTLRPHDKGLGLRHCIQCDYAPSVGAPARFLAFLAEILPDPEVRSRVQEYAGYMFLPDARFQHAQLWLGSGANGKGTLANILQAMQSRVAAVQLDALDGFKLTNLIGAPMIYCDEAPQRGINEQIIKSLIAGELVQVDRKYRDPVVARITGKWLVLANHFPTITDQSAGFWRRWDVIPFDVTIPPAARDATLAEYVIRYELSGVLNWAIEGLLRLLARGRFDPTPPVAIQSAIREARLETNSVAAWWEDICGELTADANTEKTKAYSYYADWARTHGMSPVSAPKFWKRITEILGADLVLKKVRGLRFCNISLQGYGRYA